jgi:hypothetical protein
VIFEGLDNGQSRVDLDVPPLFRDLLPGELESLDRRVGIGESEGLEVQSYTTDAAAP